MQFFPIFIVVCLLLFHYSKILISPISTLKYSKPFAQRNVNMKCFLKTILRKEVYAPFYTTQISSQVTILCFKYKPFINVHLQKVYKQFLHNCSFLNRFFAHGQVSAYSVPMEPMYRDKK